MAGTVAATSGNASVYSPQTKFEEANPRKLSELESKVRAIKSGQADLRSMFEIRKKTKEKP